MKNEEEKTKIRKKKRTLLFLIIGVFVVLQTYILIKSMVDDSNEEKTNVSITSINSLEPQVVLIEQAPTQEPVEEKLYAELVYEEELISNIVAQGMNFNDFSAFNDATVGVLAVPGTNIYYPICGSDSDTQWLETLFNGKSSAYGTIFLDFTNNKDLSGRISTLFGHNMKDGRMFAALNKYVASEEYFKNHEYAFISTKDYIYVYKFACSARVLDEEVPKLRDSYFETEEEFKNYLEILTPRIKYQDENINLEDSEHLLQLITCTGGGHSKRTSVYFDYQEKIPNVLNNLENNEEVQKEINDTAGKKNNFVAMAKNVISYNLTYDSNYTVVQGVKDSIYIWTKDKLGEKERQAFIDMYKLSSSSNYIFINGHNTFDIDGKNVSFEPLSNSTIIFCEENAIKSVKNGKFNILIDKTLDSKLTLNNY